MRKSGVAQFKLLLSAAGISLLIACGGGGGSGGSGSSGATLSDIDGDGVNNSLDLDADGDGLIEIRTQQELDQMRFVLDGTGRRTSATDSINTTGCQNKCRGYELLTDIALDLTDPSGWQPIGNINGLKNLLEPNQTVPENKIGNAVLFYCEGDAFSAVFDGNGRTVSNLRINRPNQNCIGLFAKANNEIRNLKIQATEIKGKNAVGTLAGDGSSAKITSVHSETKIVEGFGNASIGGLIGTMHGSSIAYSSARTESLSTQSQRIGGLVGDMDSTNITHSASLSINITGNKNSFPGNVRTGGLIGWGHRSVIRDSFSISEKIEANHAENEDDHMVGGLAGQISGRVINSHAITGTISARASLGGLIGQPGTSIPGITGSFQLINSFALTEQITGEDSIGGLIGLSSTSLSLSGTSHAITGAITGRQAGIGGLVGVYSSDRPIRNSYAITGKLKGRHEIGGLIGDKENSITVFASYAIAHSLEGGDLGGLIGYNPWTGKVGASYTIAAHLKGGDDLGGLIGQNLNPLDTEETRALRPPAEITASYAVTDNISGGNDLGGLIGEDLGSDTIIRSSYWDNLTNGNTTTLQSATLADEWTNNDTLGDSAVWCDENNNATIEENEKRDDNLIWEFGNNDQYPVIACTPPNVLGLKQERWRELKNGKPNVPDSAELIQLIRDYRNQQRAAFSPEQLGTP